MKKEKIKKVKKTKGESIMSKWNRPDIWFIFALMALVSMGLVFVFDTCYTTRSASFGNGYMQIGWILAGIGCVVGLNFVDLRFIKKFTPEIVVLCMFLLVYMLFKGTEVNGATRWIKAGPFTIQPPEFAKVSLVLGLAFMIDACRFFEYKAYLPGKVNYGWFYWIGILLCLTLLCIAKSSFSAIILYVLTVIIMAFYGNFQKTKLGKTVMPIVFFLMLISYPCVMYYANNLYNKDNFKDEKLSVKMANDADLLEKALEKPETERDETEKLLVSNFYRENFSIEEALERKPSQRNEYENLLVNNHKIYTEDYEEAKKKSRENRNEYEAYLVKNYGRLYFDEDLTDDGETLKIKRENRGYIESFASDDTKEMGWRSKRFVAWVNPKKYANSTGLQPAYSMTAVATGGFFGKGLGEGICKFAIPESHNDYIFASMAEETGFLGGLIMLALYGFLVFRSFVIMTRCNSCYGKILVCGCVTVIAMEVFINIMVALNVIPSTGVCLPFISYGGSATLANFMLAGIILTVSRQSDVPDGIISVNRSFNTPRGARKEPVPYSLGMKVKMNK